MEILKLEDQEIEKQETPLNEIPNQENPFSKLTMDLQMNILSRLPLKTISQCRWVSKIWYTFILHPHFAKLHFTKSSSLSPSLCFHHYSPTCIEFYVIDHQDFDNNETIATGYNAKLGDHMFDKYDFLDYDFLGSVNGLVLFSLKSYQFTRYSYPFYVCNPITREYLRLPKPPRNHTHVNVLKNGFGYDSVNDEYKVIRILEHDKKFEAEVFTLGSESWRVIENLPDVFFFPSLLCQMRYNVFVNDSLHWLTQENQFDWKIAAFNLGREDVKVFRIPPEENDAIRGFGVLRERLCVVGDAYSDDLVVWVMKEYGVERSWAKECVIRSRVIDSRWFGGFQVMQVKNGQLLVLGRERTLGYYDIRKKIFTRIVINTGEGELTGQIEHPVIPVGSLFSPKNVGRR